MTDYIQTALLNINAIVCAVTAVRLFLWRLSTSPTGFWQAGVIYALIVACATVCIRTLTGDYYFADWSEAVINAALCLFSFMRGGNLFQQEVKNENR